MDLTTNPSDHPTTVTSTHGANYFLIFVALCVCTVVSVATDLVHLPGRYTLATIVLAVAVAKALFVVTYFMHLKFEGRWKFLLLTPTLILAFGLPLALLPDIGIHYYQWTEAAREGASDAPPADE